MWRTGEWSHCSLSGCTSSTEYLLIIAHAVAAEGTVPELHSFCRLSRAHWLQCPAALLPTPCDHNGNPTGVNHWVSVGVDLWGVSHSRCMDVDWGPHYGANHIVSCHVLNDFGTAGAAL